MIGLSGLSAGTVPDLTYVPYEVDRVKLEFF
jgi:hypothetical protein